MILADPVVGGSGPAEVLGEQIAPGDIAGRRRTKRLFVSERFTLFGCLGRARGTERRTYGSCSGLIASHTFSTAIHTLMSFLNALARLQGLKRESNRLRHRS